MRIDDERPGIEWPGIERPGVEWPGIEWPVYQKLGYSWVSHHNYLNRWHKFYFIGHSTSFFVFLVMTVLHALTILRKTWLPFHRWIGKRMLHVVYPWVILTGAGLCAYVRPRADRIIFQVYGLSFTLLYIQQLLLTLRLQESWWGVVHVSHKILAGCQAHVLWHCGTKYLFPENPTEQPTRQRRHPIVYGHLTLLLCMLPWIHWFYHRWKTHQHTGLMLWYTGILGTIFSFTHDPFPDWLQSPVVILPLYILVHGIPCWILFRKG